MKETSLVCRGYEVTRVVGELVGLRVDFLLKISPTETEDIADALKNIETYLSGGVDIVKAVDNKNRCFYCGVLNDLENIECEKCGAPI